MVVVVDKRERDLDDARLLFEPRLFVGDDIELDEDVVLGVRATGAIGLPPNLLLPYGFLSSITGLSDGLIDVVVGTGVVVVVVVDVVVVLGVRLSIEKDRTKKD